MLFLTHKAGDKISIGEGITIEVNDIYLSNQNEYLFAIVVSAPEGTNLQQTYPNTGTGKDHGEIMSKPERYENDDGSSTFICCLQESILIGDDIELHMTKLNSLNKSPQLRMGYKAPKSEQILREDAKRKTPRPRRTPEETAAYEAEELSTETIKLATGQAKNIEGHTTISFRGLSGEGEAEFRVISSHLVLRDKLRKKIKANAHETLSDVYRQRAGNRGKLDLLRFPGHDFSIHTDTGDVHYCKTINAGNGEVTLEIKKVHETPTPKNPLGGGGPSGRGRTTISNGMEFVGQNIEGQHFELDL